MPPKKNNAPKPVDMQADMQADIAAAEKEDELETISAIFGDDFSELSALYRTDSPKRIAILQEAIAAGDQALTARVAHAFSGSCASIGATRLSALCKELELLAKDAAAQGLQDKLAEVAAEYQRVSAKIRSLA
jgi:HPt (histidine-containing phosphotransfer) domain-containing protein